MAIYENNSLSAMKRIGMFQNNYIWKVQFVSTPVDLGPIQFQIRTTTIPEKRRSKEIIRINGKQFTQPTAITYDAEWATSILMDETHKVYDQIVAWVQLIDNAAIALAVHTPGIVKGVANVELCGLADTTINKKFQIIGLYPLNQPEVPDLNQENTEGMISFDVTWAYDDIDFGANFASF